MIRPLPKEADLKSTKSLTKLYNCSTKMTRFIVGYSTTVLLLAITLFLASTSQQTQAYVITIEPSYEDDCYHERAPIGTKIGFSYEVIEGGFTDIDVYIKDPNGGILFSEDKSTSGKVTIETTLEGPYEFCFGMKKSSFSNKLIIFDIDRSDAYKIKSSEHSDKTPEGGEKADDDTSKLVSMVDALMLSTVTSRHDVRYLTARDRIHRKINEKTNSNLVWWSGVEILLLMAVTIGQVWYLRRFFEVRRKA